MKKVFSVLVAVLILAVSAMPVFAAPSPTASKEYKIVVHNNKGGSGTYTTKVDKDGKHATITAHPKNGYKFEKWVIKGKYKIVNGDLTSKKLTLILKGDVEATPIFTKKGSKSSGSTTHISRNTSPVSPKTGDNTLYFAIMISVGALLVLTALGVKISTAKASKK